jgi:hypothetical protein
MKSGKQRRQEIVERRAKRKTVRAARLIAANKAKLQARRPVNAVDVNEHALAHYNSYGQPDFVERGFYLDVPFTCVSCGKQEIWTAHQQKWWYEVAKGPVQSTANRCRPCRRRERDRSAESRRAHLEGLTRKKLSRS